MNKVSRFARVNQWLQFARQWHLMDANHQDAYKLGEKVARHLAGKHKPIWHPETDCGDHVVVINCKGVAMQGFDWKHRLYYFNTQYPRGKDWIPAYQLHEYDPCRIVFLAVYKELGKPLIRRYNIQRLHLFPDDQVPDFIKKNLGNQLEQVQAVPKRSDEYTEEERKAFPRLVKFPKDHVVDWEAPVEDSGWYERENPYEKKKKT